MLFSDLIKINSPNLIKDKKTKLMRHQFRDDRTILKNHKFTDEEIKDENLINNVLLQSAKLSAIRADSRLAEIYCAEQGNDELKDTDIVFAFAACLESKAEFIGAFQVVKKSNQDAFLEKYNNYLSELPSRLEELWGLKKYVTLLGYSALPAHNSHYYDLKPIDDAINQYRNRVIIDWPNPRVWVQTSLDKEILEIRARGFVREFVDYYDFILSFVELKAILNQPEGNPIWINKLSAVSGVYLITDNKTGNQYIGSAYGSDGFLGRWIHYANNIHGGNKGLEELIGIHGPDYASNFQISILRVMDKSTHKNEVIASESFLKQKLGTRVHGHNYN